MIKFFERSANLAQYLRSDPLPDVTRNGKCSASLAHSLVATGMDDRATEEFHNDCYDGVLYVFKFDIRCYLLFFCCSLHNTLL